MLPQDSLKAFEILFWKLLQAALEDLKMDKNLFGKCQKNMEMRLFVWLSVDHLNVLW